MISAVFLFFRLTLFTLLLFVDENILISINSTLNQHTWYIRHTRCIYIIRINLDHMVQNNLQTSLYTYSCSISFSCAISHFSTLFFHPYSLYIYIYFFFRFRAKRKQCWLYTMKFLFHFFVLLFSNWNTYNIQYWLFS